MTKNKLWWRAYWMLLHSALERELTFVPKTVKELQKGCKELAALLRRVPQGDELAEDAKHDAGTEWIQKRAKE